MATLVGVNEELRLRIEDMVRRCPRLRVSSAYRSKAEQLRLYNGWLRRKPGFAPANPPGSSKHEIGLAVDVSAIPADEATRKRLAGQCGVHTPIKGEPWHMELAPKRGPVPQSPPPPDRKADPIIVTDFGDVTMRKITVHVPKLDRDGNGYVDVDCKPDRVVSFTGQGPNPPKDGYWDAVQFAHQDFGGKTRVTITEGRPYAEVRFSIWVA